MESLLSVSRNDTFFLLPRKHSHAYKVNIYCQPRVLSDDQSLFWLFVDCIVQIKRFYVMTNRYTQTRELATRYSENRLWMEKKMATYKRKY